MYTLGSRGFRGYRLLLCPYTPALLGKVLVLCPECVRLCCGTPYAGLRGLPALVFYGKARLNIAHGALGSTFADPILLAPNDETPKWTGDPLCLHLKVFFVELRNFWLTAQRCTYITGTERTGNSAMS